MSDGEQDFINLDLDEDEIVSSLVSPDQDKIDINDFNSGTNESDSLSNVMQIDECEGNEPQKRLLKVILGLKKDLEDTIAPNLKDVSDIVLQMFNNSESISFPKGEQEGWEKWREGHVTIRDLKTLKLAVSKIIPLLHGFELQLHNINHNGAQEIIQHLGPLGSMCSNAKLEAKNVITLILRTILNIRVANRRWAKLSVSFK
jgi:hypothetical protein